MFQKTRLFFLAILKKNPEILWVILFWILVQSTGIIVRAFIPFAHENGGFPWLTEANPLSNYFYNFTQTWDSIHYSRIAEFWYPAVDHIGKKDYIYAFFPLYPALIASVTVFTGSITVSMIALTLLLPLAGFYLLRKFFALYFSQLDSKILTSLALLMPFSLFFFVNYTESLYLILELAVLYFIYKKNQNWFDWIVAILLGLLIVWNRSVGLLFVGSFFLVYFIYWIIQSLKKRQLSKETSVLVLRTGLLSFGAGLGLISFFTHNLIRTGNFYVSRTVQDYFGRGSTLNPLEPFGRGIQDIVNGDHFSRGVFFIPIIVLVLYLVMRKISKDYQALYLFTLASFVYTLLTIYLNLTANSLASTNRYVLTSPLYLIGLPVILLGLLNKYNRLWILPVIYSILLLFLLISIAVYTRHLWLG